MINLFSDQNEGFRATPAASDRHAARLAFQRVSVLIAESAYIEGMPFGGWAARRLSDPGVPAPFVTTNLSARLRCAGMIQIVALLMTVAGLGGTGGVKKAGILC